MMNMNANGRKRWGNSAQVWLRFRSYDSSPYSRKSESGRRSSSSAAPKLACSLPFPAQTQLSLPCRIHASRAQFLALKKRVDPSNKFRNKLWDTYYR